MSHAEASAEALFLSRNRDGQYGRAPKPSWRYWAFFAGLYRGLSHLRNLLKSRRKNRFIKSIECFEKRLLEKKTANKNNPLLTGQTAV